MIDGEGFTSSREIAEYLMAGPFSLEPGAKNIFGAAYVESTHLMGPEWPMCRWAHSPCLSPSSHVVWGPCNTDHVVLTLCPWHVIEQILRVKHFIAQYDGAEIVACRTCGYTGTSFRYCPVRKHESFKAWWKQVRGVDL